MTMNHISIDGGYYTPQHTLKLFSTNKQVASVIYGKNGSGKSSIARAIKQSTTQQDISQKEFKNIEYFLLKQHPHQGIDPTSYPKPSVPCYVHNENFTYDNLAINSEGLTTIVIFGEQIEISKEINQLNDAIESTTSNILSLEEQKSDLDNKKNPNSYLFIAEEIKENLKNTWAERDQTIMNKKIAGKVDKNLLSEILKLPLPKQSLQELKKIFNANLHVYQNVQAAEPLKEFQKVSLTNDIKLLIKELAINVPFPQLSPKEDKILKLIQSSKEFRINESKNFFKSETEICPTCLSILDDNYKDNCLNIINLILNTNEANTVIKKLKSSNIQPSMISLVIPQTLQNLINPESFKTFSTLTTHFNNKLLKLDELKSQKIVNPYVAIIVEEQSYSDLIEEINNYIEEFNLTIKNFNEQITQKNNLLTSLKKINKDIARSEFNHLITSYHSKRNTYIQLTSEIEQKNNKNKLLEQERNEKQASLANVNIALDLINSYLSYIFYDETRLYLQHEEDKYKIMSRGLPVKPSSLSVGEKNIISLCYFFSTLFANESISELFSKKCILVLDDPLSSFDFENKVGVYSFLRYILSELHGKNPESKSLILTHDLDVLYNLAKVYDDIDIKENDKLKLFNLNKKELIDIKTKNFDEYSLLLQNIYEFIHSPQTSMNEINIGNNMRRILEAFSTFNYKCGIDGISKNEEILGKLKASYQPYFKNSMYRLILNSESHLQERSKQILNTTFKEHFSLDEKVKTAKDILMFLYLLDPVHLKIHLKKDKSDSNLICSQIETWITETFERSLVPQIS